MKQTQTRSSAPRPAPSYVDPETMRLSDLQMEFLGLVGIAISAAGRASLAAAARVRLAAPDAD